MKVEYLKELLSLLPDDLNVILSSDGEGNEYSPWSDFEIGYYVPESSWHGECYSEDEPPIDGKKCIILYPKN